MGHQRENLRSLGQQAEKDGDPAKGKRDRKANEQQQQGNGEHDQPNHVLQNLGTTFGRFLEAQKNIDIANDEADCRDNQEDK